MIRDILKGFRDFIFRGNVVDLAVAVILGAAFNGIVQSLVKDVLNPLIAATVGKPDFSGVVLQVHSGKIAVGNFLNAVVSFLIVAAVIYFAIVLPIHKMMERVKNATAGPAAPAITKTCPECLSEIPAGARRCAHCGQPQAQPQAQPEADEPVGAGQTTG